MGRKSKDLIVMGIGGLRGAHVVPFWVFRRTTAAYVLVLGTGGDGLSVTKRRWKNFREIQAINQTAGKVTTTTYRFDGNQYRESLSVTKPVD